MHEYGSPLNKCFPSLCIPVLTKIMKKKQSLYADIHSAVRSEWHIFFFKVTNYLLLKNVVLLFSCLPSVPLTDFSLTELQIMFSDLLLCFIFLKEERDFLAQNDKMGGTAQLHKVATAAASKYFSGTTGSQHHPHHQAVLPAI